MILCSTFANILLKKSSSVHGLIGPFQKSSFYTAIALILYISSLLIYQNILRITSLSIAQSYLAFQFISIIVASAIFLSEKITFIHLIGICFITIGIFISHISISN
jgi:drug/metabolite transporter (DMT)-like permease